MSARVDEELGEGVLAIYNGMKFKLNDLVDVIVGTGLGVGLGLGLGLGLVSRLHIYNTEGTGTHSVRVANKDRSQ
jgi:hypothetical protein